MDKLNPQPEPPSDNTLGGWFTFLFRYAFWVITLPFQLLADVLP